MEWKTEGIIFQIQRFSVYDGTGIRTNVFLKGCPLRCIWCHNPEGMSPENQICYTPEKCISCGACTAVCPQGAHRMERGSHILEFARCRSCMKCTEEICWSGAIREEGRICSVSQVMEEVLADQAYYHRSGGGMTLSGGEPFCQPDFAIALLQAAKEHGLNTAVETCGMGRGDTFEEAACYTDQFLFDYKVTGEELHKKVAGVSQTPILRNLDLLDSLSADLILRCPMVPGINDNREHYRGIGEVVRRHSHIREIHIMPYHALGNGKYRKLGMEIPFRGETMPMARAEEIRAQLTEYVGVPVRVM